MMFPVRVVFSLKGKTEVDGINYITAGMSNSGPAGQTWPLGWSQVACRMTRRIISLGNYDRHNEK